MLRVLPAILHGIALLIALNVQVTGGLLAGLWLPFHLAGCAVLLSRGGYPKQRNLAWWLSLAWLLALVVSTFILKPVVNGALQMWFLTSMPMIALCLRKEDLREYEMAFTFVVLIYACGLIAQWLLNVHYTNGFDYRNNFLNRPYVAWPLLDPNNAAAVLNLALIPRFYAMLRSPPQFVVVLILLLALLATGSKAGIACAALACFILVGVRFRLNFKTLGWGLILTTVCLSPVWDKILLAIRNSTDARLEVWGGSVPLLSIAPWRGVGLGQFAEYYTVTRLEHNTAGFFAHNDVMQFAIEMGWPAAALFVLLAVSIARQASRVNIVAVCTLLTIFLQSMLEFQFYVPAVSLGLGWALGYVIADPKRPSTVTPRGELALRSLL